MLWLSRSERLTFARREHTAALRARLPEIDRWDLPMWYVDWHAMRLICRQHSEYTMAEEWGDPLVFKAWYENQFITRTARPATRVRNPYCTHFGPQSTIYVRPTLWDFLQVRLPRVLTCPKPDTQALVQVSRYVTSSRIRFYLEHTRKMLMRRSARYMKLISGVRHRMPWTGAEEDYLRANVGRLLVETMAAELGRTKNGVYGKLVRMGLHTPDPVQPWTEAENARLAQYVGATEAELIEAFPGRAVHSVRTRMCARGLTSSRARPEDETRAVMEYVAGRRTMRELRAEFPHRPHHLLLKQASDLRQKVFNVNEE